MLKLYLVVQKPNPSVVVIRQPREVFNLYEIHALQSERNDNVEQEFGELDIASETMLSCCEFMYTV